VIENFIGTKSLKKNFRETNEKLIYL